MNLYEQCWANAYESKDDYVVPVNTIGQAVSFRAQCHKWRRKSAEAIYGDRYEDHPLYELEIRITENPITVSFHKRDRIVLPPVNGQAAAGLWCLMQRPEEGFTVERHQVPVTDPAFVEGYETEGEAQAALTKRAASKQAIFSQG